MTNFIAGLSALSDRALLSEVEAAARHERAATARLIALLMEVDHRRLYLGEGSASLFTFCTQVLHLSEHAAYGRIEAARAARRFPLILDLLEQGAITLTTVTLLAPHLTAENHARVLGEARHKSKREVELIVAGLRPQPDVAPSVRRLPQPRVTAPQTAMACDAAPPCEERQQRRDTDLLSADVTVAMAEASPSPPAAPRPAVVVPLAPERFKIQCTISRDTHDKLRRVQDLLRHAIPTGNIATILDRALTLCWRTSRRRSAPPWLAHDQHGR